MGLHSIKQYYRTVKLRIRCIRLLKTSQGVSQYTHEQLFTLYIQLVVILREITVDSVHGSLPLDLGLYSHYLNYEGFIKAHSKEDGPLKSNISNSPEFRKVHDWFDLSLTHSLPDRLNRLIKIMANMGALQIDTAQDRSDYQYIGRVYQSVILDSLTILELCLTTCNIRSNLCRTQE